MLVAWSGVARADEFATSPARPGYEATDQILAFARRTD
jgi:hypothetical protein